MVQLPQDELAGLDGIGVTIYDQIASSNFSVPSSPATDSPVSASQTSVRKTYSISGTLAVTNNLSIVDSSVPVSMTLGSAIEDGHEHTIKQFGNGAVTLTATIDRIEQSIVLNSTASIGDSLSLTWLSDDATYIAG